MAFSTKRVVPWNSMEEWGRVYKQVYSQSLEDKRNSLDQMTAWKSRVDKLPVGVECSLYMLQAILRDEELQRNPTNFLSGNDVVLMYSTAIIRFVNLISHLGQVDTRHQAISSIAEMAGIPDWVVGIRHEATHAKMPSLKILRAGAQLAMEWLKDNYWQTEETDSFDLYWPESKAATSRMLRAKKRMSEKWKRTDMNTGTAPAPAPEYEVIPKELHLAFSMLVELLQEMVTRRWMNEIESKDLHKYAYILWRQTKTLTVTFKERDIANLAIPLSKVRRLILKQIEQILSEWVDTDEDDNNQLNKEQLDTLKGRCVVSAFCQNPDVYEEMAEGTVFTNLTSVWRMIQEYRSIPYFLTSLVTRVIEDDKERGSHLRLISDLTEAVLKARDFPDDETNLFKFDEGFQSVDWHQLVMTVMEQPHPDTWAVVSRFFKLYETPVNKKLQEKVATLLRLYLDNNSTAKPSEQTAFGKSHVIHATIFTVEMLNPLIQPSNVKAKEAKKDELPAGHVSPADQAQVIDEWTLCPDYDWSRIPIGSLPGVSNELELNGVEWELVQAESSDSDSEQLVSSTKRIGERFDWNSLMRKRRRRGGLTKEGPEAINITTI